RVPERFGAGGRAVELLERLDVDQRGMGGGARQDAQHETGGQQDGHQPVTAHRDGRRAEQPRSPGPPRRAVGAGGSWGSGGSGGVWLRGPAGGRTRRPGRHSGSFMAGDQVTFTSSWRAINSPLPPAWLSWRQVSYLSGQSARRLAVAFSHCSVA